jgi:hypothetical protein
MCCFLGLLAIFVPRVTIVLLWLLTDFINAAYVTILWPLLGLIFMPFTTLAYAYAMHATGGHVSGAFLVLVVIAAMADLGALGGGGAAGRRKR